jgi:hypothetical protein
MFLPDRLAAWVRTLWPLAIGHIAAWALLRLNTLGVPADQTLVVEVVAVVATAVVYGAGRWLETRTGEGRAARVARGLGRWVLSLGLETGPPVYPNRPGTRIHYPDDTRDGVQSARTVAAFTSLHEGDPAQVRPSRVWRRVFLAATVLILVPVGMEIWAAADGSAVTETWTDMITANVEVEVVFAVVGGLVGVAALWLPAHFWRRRHRYRNTPGSES